MKLPNDSPSNSPRLTGPTHAAGVSDVPGVAGLAAKAKAKPKAPRAPKADGWRPKSIQLLGKQKVPGHQAATMPRNAGEAGWGQGHGWPWQTSILRRVCSVCRLAAKTSCPFWGFPTLHHFDQHPHAPRCHQMGSSLL